MPPDDSKTLEEALFSLNNCEESIPWTFGADSWANLEVNACTGELEMDFELPVLTEQSLSIVNLTPPSQLITPQLQPCMEPIQLSCVDNCSISSAIKSLSPPTSINTRKRAKQTRKHSNRARDLRREELVYLRQKVTDLQLQLNQRRSKPKLETASTPCLSSSVALQGRQSNVATRRRALCATVLPIANPTGRTASLWSDMAQRQALERQKAERENVRLKLVVEKQLQLAKSLERILKKGHCERVFGITSKPSRSVMASLGSEAAHEDHLLLMDIDKSRHELDNVFKANGLGHLETANCNAKIEHDAAQGMVLAINANKLMPFDVRTTGKAVWRHFAHSMDHMPHRTYYQKQPLHVETSDDTVMEQYGVKITNGQTNGDFHVKHIIRRYVEHDRILVVWRTITDTVEFSAELTSGIRFLEKGYIVVKPPVLGQEDCTLMQTCYIIRPEVHHWKESHQARKVGALLDFVQSSVSGSISASHQMIENVLLSTALR